MSKMNKLKGFTLIETLVTVTIMSLVVIFLCTYFISKYKESKIYSNANKVISDIGQIIGAQEVYYSKNSAYGEAQDLLTSGVLKSWPVPPENIFNQACVDANGSQPKYEIKSVSIGGQGKNNVYVVLSCIDESVVEIVNILSLGGTPNLKQFIEN